MTQGPEPGNVGRLGAGHTCTGEPSHPGYKAPPRRLVLVAALHGTGLCRGLAAWVGVARWDSMGRAFRQGEQLDEGEMGQK